MKKTKRTIFKSVAFGITFIIAMLLLTKTSLPSTIKALIEYKNDTSDTAIWDPNKPLWPIIIFRIAIYLVIPIFLSFFDFNKKEKRNYGIRLIENLECQFFAYSFITAIYYIFGLDILFRADIFSIQDSVIFVCSAIATLVIDKKIVSQVRENGESNADK